MFNMEHKIFLTLWLPITTKYRLLVHSKHLRSKQCGSRSDFSSMSILIWVYTVCLYGKIKHLQSSADNIFKCIFFIAAKGLNMKLTFNTYNLGITKTWDMSMNPDQTGSSGTISFAHA